MTLTELKCLWILTYQWVLGFNLRLMTSVYVLG